MDQLLNILQYTLPSVVVLLTVYLMMKHFLRREEVRQQVEYRLNNQKITTPIRLQSYERMALFLERIRPEALALRTQQAGMTSKQLQRQILSVIRAEYEHNLSQQIYISPESWKLVKRAKEQMIALLNSIAQEVVEDAPAMELSKALVQTVMELDDSPIENALLALKRDMNELF